ncbi:MAG: class I SAM-dependent methyltransferase [Firmicutes bacterium]|nr:class I SAM-dependent methyltransferase [Bacillota bacterium]
MDHYFTNNQNLKSEIKTLSYSHGGYDYIFLSDNGVFSKEHIDYGSKLLLETFLKNRKALGNVLDVGCGYGFMGIVIAKELQSNVTMIDINKRALHLTQRNLIENKVSANVFESNGYENVKDKYDVIITNPPVRAGKQILLNILLGAKEHLNKNGELWYVLRKDHGAKSMMKVLNEHYQVETIEKSKGFYIFCCKTY